jgi:CRP/FNR family cyclic AMP-dependent transcriptional regulator
MSTVANSPQTHQGAPRTEKAIVDIIRDHPFLRGLRPEYQRLLADCATRMRYDKDELIFRDGDPANRFYLIEQGHVSLETPAHPQSHPPQSVAMIGPGDVLGWSWLFPPYCWQFDARTLEPTEAIFFYGSRLREYCEQDHDFGFEMMKRMTQVIIQRLQAARRELLANRTPSPAAQAPGQKP